jgi:hypothetical protein
MTADVRCGNAFVSSFLGGWNKPRSRISYHSLELLKSLAIVKNNVNRVFVEPCG